MQEEIFDYLNAYIKDTENYDDEHFKRILSSAIEKDAFDIDIRYEFEQEIENKKLHKNQQQFWLTQENLLHIAINVGNMDAAKVLIAAGADIFSIYGLYKITNTFNRYGYVGDYRRERIEEKSAVKKFIKQFGEYELHDLQQTIMANCLEKFNAGKYGDDEFSYLAKLHWWDNDALATLYKIHRGYTENIVEHLKKSTNDYTANQFVSNLMLAEYFGTDNYPPDAKARIMEDLLQAVPKLEVGTFYWLCKLEYFSSEDLHNLQEHYGKAYLEKLKTEGGLTDEKNSLSPYELMERYKNQIAGNNEYFSQIQEYYAELESIGIQAAEEAQQDEYEEHMATMQRSDYEIPITNLKKQSRLLLLELAELAEPLAPMAAALKECWPEDETNFKYLALEFPILYELFAQKLADYEDKLAELSEVNKKFYSGGLDEEQREPHVEARDLQQYNKLLVRAGELIEIENIINAKGLRIYKNVDREFYEVSEEIIQPVKKAKQEVKAPPVDPVILMATEYRQQQYVNSKFFRVKAKSHIKENKNNQLKPEKPSKKLYNQIKLAINKGNKSPIDIEGYSTRSVIIALAHILRKSEGFPTILYFKIGETVLALIPNKTKNQVGNAKIEVLNEVSFSFGKLAIASVYSDDSIYNYLKKITDADPEREKNLAKEMAERSVRITAFTEADFTTWKQIIKFQQESSINVHKLSADSRSWLTYKIHFLNQLNFLRSIFEVVRKLYRNEKGQVFPYPNVFAKRADKIPVGSAQARTSKLLQSGALSLHDAYGNSVVEDRLTLSLANGKTMAYQYDKETDRALYGVVTGNAGSEQKIALAEYKANLVNQKYRKTFFAEQDKLLLSSVKTQHYEEMKSEYGSGNESADSDSDYDNDRAMNFTI